MPTTQKRHFHGILKHTGSPVAVLLKENVELIIVFKVVITGRYQFALFLDDF
jgi:hypothetical protein